MIAFETFEQNFDICYCQQASYFRESLTKFSPQLKF